MAMSGPHFKSDISFISVKLFTCNLQVFLIHNMLTGHMTTEYLKIHFRVQKFMLIKFILDQMRPSNQSKNIINS